MPFLFSGVFSDGDEAMMNAMIEQIGGVGRVIERPFNGFGIATWQGALTPESQGTVTHGKLADAIVRFSGAHADRTFVYVYEECEGGICDYAGFVARSGAIIHEEPFNDMVSNSDPLRRLLAYLNVELNGLGYFEPLTREYFGLPWHELQQQRGWGERT
jgi:hypothetical protein